MPSNTLTPALQGGRAASGSCKMSPAFSAGRLNEGGHQFAGCHLRPPIWLSRLEHAPLMLSPQCRSPRMSWLDCLIT